MATDPEHDQRARDALLVHCVALAFFAIAGVALACGDRLHAAPEAAEALPVLTAVSSAAGVVFWVWALWLSAPLSATRARSRLASVVYILNGAEYLCVLAALAWVAPACSCFGVLLLAGILLVSAAERAARTPTTKTTPPVMATDPASQQRGRDALLIHGIALLCFAVVLLLHSATGLNAELSPEAQQTAVAFLGMFAAAGAVLWSWSIVLSGSVPETQAPSRWGRLVRSAAVVECVLCLLGLLLQVVRHVLSITAFPTRVVIYGFSGRTCFVIVIIVSAIFVAWIYACRSHPPEITASDDNPAPKPEPRDPKP